MHVPPLSEDAVSMLLLLGMHAYHDPVLLTQLARIFRHITLANTVLFASPATIGEAYERSCMVSIVQIVRRHADRSWSGLPSQVCLLSDVKGARHAKDARCVRIPLRCSTG